MPTVLFVCTANICRSPVAEGYLRSRLAQRGLSTWQVMSAGTWALHVRGPAENSKLLLAQRGIDIGAHQSQMITGELLEEADLVLCMEEGHKEALCIEFPEHAPKIFLLSEIVGRSYSIEDPYGGELAAYRQMVDEVSRLIDDGLENIIALTSENYEQRTARG